MPEIQLRFDPDEDLEVNDERMGPFKMVQPNFDEGDCANCPDRQDCIEKAFYLLNGPPREEEA